MKISTGLLPKALKRAVPVFVLILAGYYANAQFDGCNLNFDGDNPVVRYTTHRYTVTNFNPGYSYGQWVIFGCDEVDEGIDADGEPYIDVYIWGEDGALVTYGEAAPGWYQYGEYDISLTP